MNTVVAKGEMYKVDGVGDFNVNLSATDSPDKGSVLAAGLAVLALNAYAMITAVDVSLVGGVPVAVCSTGVFTYKDLSKWKAGSGNVLPNIKAYLVAEVRQEGPNGAVGLRFFDPVTHNVIKQTQDADGNYTVVPLLIGAVTIALQPAT